MDVSSEMRSRDIKKAIYALKSAGIIHQVYTTSASGLPLDSLINEKKFKLYFLDIGLENRSTKLQSKMLLEKELVLETRDAITEQFVAQELLAYVDPFEDASLCFWQREKTNSMAEVDFVINIGPNIIPIEVKSGHTKRLKSLKIFMKEKNSKFGLRISPQPLNFQDDILSIPFYMVSEIPRLLQATVGF